MKSKIITSEWIHDLKPLRVMGNHTDEDGEKIMDEIASENAKKRRARKMDEDKYPVHLPTENK